MYIYTYVVHTVITLFTAISKRQSRKQSSTEYPLPNLKEQFSQQLKQEVQLLTSQLSHVLSYDIVRPPGNIGLIRRVRVVTVVTSCVLIVAILE